MANSILGNNKYIQATGTITGFGAVSGYPGSNLRVSQPGETARSTQLSEFTGQATLTVAREITTFGLLYTNLTRHPNLVTEANELDQSTWTLVNTTVAKNSTNYSKPGTAYSWNLTDDATAGEHTIEQKYILPSTLNYAQIYLTKLRIAADSGSSLDARLRLEDNAGNYAEVPIDLGLGTTGTITYTGTWANGSVTIAAADNIGTGSQTFYDVEFYATSPASIASVTVMVLCESAGAISYSGSGEAVSLNALQLNLGSTALDWYPTGATNSGALVRYLNNTVTLAAWDHAAKKDWTALPYLHLLYHGAAFSGRILKVEMDDPGNADAYLEAGNFVAMKALQPAMDIESGWRWEHKAAASGAPYRVLNGEWSWLTSAEAEDALDEIQRLSPAPNQLTEAHGGEIFWANANPVLLAIDPVSANLQRRLAWGPLLESSGAHRSYSAQLGAAAFTAPVRVREMKP